MGGKITSNSYVPAGLTAAEYEKVRNGDAAKKAANYQRNVKKAGVFEDYTEFYTKRGTDTGESWNKGPTKGHRMAKTSTGPVEKTLLLKLVLLLRTRAGNKHV